MQISTSGGGFFAKSFVSTDAFQGYFIAPAPAAGVYGNWVHLFPLRLTNPGRWVRFECYTNLGLTGIYNYQIARGGPGAEIQWLPTNLQAFSVAFDALLPHMPYTLTFPFTIPGGQDISIRCNFSAPAGPALFMNIYVWN